jgi:hypothetical protein
MNPFWYFQHNSISKTCHYRPLWFEDLWPSQATGQGRVGEPRDSPVCTGGEEVCQYGEVAVPGPDGEGMGTPAPVRGAGVVVLSATALKKYGRL